MGRVRRRKRLPTEPLEAQIESLAHDGKGVAHVDGKATFIHGSLAGERVRFQLTGRWRRYDEGRVVEVLQPSSERVEPRCRQFGICGGCSLQHQDHTAQILAKQRALLEAFEHIGKVSPAEQLSPLVADSSWGYRRKARLGVRHVPKKGGVLVGFRERSSSKVADIEVCHVLHPKVGQLLPRLRELIDGLSLKEKLPQIEMAMGDEICVLIFRLLESPGREDLDRLSAFGDAHGVAVYLQEGGPETIQPLNGAGVELSYALPGFDLRLCFLPSDFTQVNSAINRAMTRRAVELLEPDATDKVLDLFCGIGNFTLPLARRAGAVTGVEGDAGLVARAWQNASRNGIANADFFTANLYDTLQGEPWLARRYDKVLLDPPRSGAQEVLAHLPGLGARRILYVSCYPGTLARDAGILVHQLGYRLVSAGVMDMFPHTAHVESMALFERG